MADGESTHDKWLEPPVITALSDAPLKKKTFEKDNFGLARTMGPIYDILRHPDTQTPLSIGIYGSWGAGKSTAMHWLEDRLHHWTANAPETDDKVKVHSTWFYPWKYDTKEDVWRGLIAEVLIACLTKIEGTSAKTWTKMAKDVGGFLGKSFVHALSSVKLSGAGVELSMAELMKVADEAVDFVNPSRAYLNEFETVLSSTVQDTLGNDENGQPKNRLVVFIDDLDRCLPAVALQVLEALKLYLNIPDLVFVLGVDDDVVKQLIVKHYADMGVAADKSQQYLAKMFQVEVLIAPMEQKLGEFLGKQIENNASWAGLELDDNATAVFRDTILALAGGVPREIKRLVNYVLMAGRGVQLIADDKDDITATEAIQFYLLHKALGRHNCRDMLTKTDVQRLFYEVSRANQGQDLTDMADEDLSRFSEYHGAKLNHLITTEGAEGILKDPNIRTLLTLEFPAPDRLGGLTATVQPRTELRSWQSAFERAMGGTTYEAATDDDLATIVHLDFYGTDLQDLTRLRNLKNLEALYFNSTQVTDLEPLRNLKHIKSLSFVDTQVTDLAPLRNLENIQALDFSGTQVTDLAPLRNLKNIELLSFDDAQVEDLEPLRDLKNIKSLSFDNTHVAELEPLRDLKNIRVLSFCDTRVADLDPLRNLENITVLHFNNTQVADLKPLRDLKNIEVLTFGDTQVADLEPLRDLKNIEVLNLRGTQVADLAPLGGMEKLHQILLKSTPARLAQVEQLKQERPELHFYFI